MTRATSGPLDASLDGAAVPRMPHCAPIEAACEQLARGIAGRVSLQWLVGDGGLGKSTVLERLREKLSSPSMHVVQVSYTHLLLPELIEYVHAALPGAADSSQDPRALRHALAALHRAGTTVVILIDDAQALGAGVPGALAELLHDDDGTALAQLIVAVTPAFVETLNGAGVTSPQAAQAESTCWLRPWDRDSVYGFARAFESGSGTEQVVFAPDALEGLYEHSQGNPRALRMLCTLALAAASAHREQLVNRQRVDRIAIDPYGFDEAQDPVAEASEALLPNASEATPGAVAHVAATPAHEMPPGPRKPRRRHSGATGWQRWAPRFVKDMLSDVPDMRRHSHGARRKRRSETVSAAAVGAISLTVAMATGLALLVSHLHPSGVELRSALVSVLLAPFESGSSAVAYNSPKQPRAAAEPSEVSSVLMELKGLRDELRRVQSRIASMHRTMRAARAAAEEMRTSLGELQAMNSERPETPAPGASSETRPTSEPARSTPVADVLATPREALSDAPAQARYTVKAGDTLWNIARRHRMSVTELEQLNALRSGAVLRTGQVLSVWSARVASAMSVADAAVGTSR